MTTSLITRCPKCSTAFNVTEAHLSTANGAVRCGSCLNVFNGRENLITPAAPTPKKHLDDDNLLISNDLKLHDHDNDSKDDHSRVNTHNEAEEHEDDESWALKLLEEEGHNPSLLGLDIPEKKAAPQPKQLPLDKELQPIYEESQPIDKELQNEGNKEFQPEENREPQPEENREPQPEENRELQLTIEKLQPTIKKLQPTTEKPQPVIEELQPKEDNRKPQPEIENKTLLSTSEEPETSSQATTPTSTDLETSHLEATETSPTGIETESSQKVNELDAYRPQMADDDNEIIAELTPASLKAEEYAATKAKEPEPEADIDEEDFEDLRKTIDEARVDQSQTSEDGVRTLVDSIELEAVELQYTAKRPAWVSKLLWFILAILAGSALAAQVAWLKFGQWSTQQPYRPYYAIACEYLGCTLPELRDLSKIRTSNLLVRSHPSTDNALLVDVVIENHADFKQSFPKLIMVFSNIKNKVVASRAFEPSEYLGGDLQGVNMMPIQKPIRLSLELVDPGKGADSYKITVSE